MGKIPDLLWSRAWLLASAHQHEWTVALHSVTGSGGDCYVPPQPITEGMLDAIVQQYREESPRPCGVGSPFISRWGEEVRINGSWRGNWSYSAHHVTGTGRCRWTITHDGEVTITISRPAPGCVSHRERGSHYCERSCPDPIIVITVTVGIDGAVEWTPHDDCGVRYGMRHVEAVTSELRALGVNASVPPRIAELAAFADNGAVELAAQIAEIDHWEDRAEESYEK